MIIYRFRGHIVRVSADILDYNPDFYHDGGSYYQPSFRAYCPRKHEELTIDDSSCGDFGTRIYMSLRKRGNEIACAYYGSMLGEGMEYSTFSEKRLTHNFWLNFCVECLGYYIPTDNP